MPSLEVIESIENKATQNKSYLAHLPKKLVSQIFSPDNLNFEEEKRALTTSDFYQKCLPPDSFGQMSMMCQLSPGS